MKSGIFSADQHIEAFQYGKPEREQDYRRALEDTIAKAIMKKMGFVALLGDITDLKKEERETARFIRKCWKRLQKAGIPTYTLRGNHDPEKIPMSEIFGLDMVYDAEEAFCTCLTAGKSFLPYGEEGPRVCAVGYLPTEEFLAHLTGVRKEEAAKGLKMSTELWMHGALQPGAPAIASEIHVRTLHALGWHTVVAGDIHDGGLWKEENGILIYTGSKEMTDITENPEKGEWIHTPTSNEDQPTPESWAFEKYLSGRPFKRFVFPDGITTAAIREISDYAKECETTTQMKPIIDIVCPEKGLELLQTPEVKKLALRLSRRRPKVEKTTPSGEKSQPALRRLSIEDGLLAIAEKRTSLKPRALQILRETLVA